MKLSPNGFLDAAATTECWAPEDTQEKDQILAFLAKQGVTELRLIGEGKLMARYGPNKQSPTFSKTTETDKPTFDALREMGLAHNKPSPTDPPGQAV